MTLPTNNVQNSSGSDKQLNSQSGSDAKSLSPNSSPRGSPRPSPRPQQKRDHSKSDTYLSTNYKETNSSTPNKNDSSQNLDISGLNSKSDTASVAELSRSGSHESSSSSVNKDLPKERKESKNSDRPKKKSSWYNVLYPTYKSRSEDFKRIFKNVPDDERLVVDYSCALQKEILVHGRLYVTQNYLCFYANIFRWETTLTLRWKDVTAITKEKTALVIPNAILVSTESDKYFLTSFSARDKTYLMLFRIWQHALMDQPMSAQEMWQWVHTCYGDELGLTSDDEDYIAPGTEDLKLDSRISSESFPEEFAGESILETNMADDQMDDDGTTIHVSVPVPLIGATTSGATATITVPYQQRDRDLQVNSRYSPDAQIPTDMSDTTESDVERNKFDESPGNISATCTNGHEGRQLLNETFPMHVDQLFTLLFTSSKFYLDFHTSRRTADLNQSAWTHNSQTGQKTRQITLTVAISQAIGPKSSQVTETQIMLPCSRPGQLYSIDVESTNAGIPYADSFAVLIHYCIEKVTDMECQLIVYAQIKYKKNVWGLVKSLIEKNCWAGLEEFYTSLAKALQMECEEIIHPVVKRKSRKRRRAPLLPVGESNHNYHHHHHQAARNVTTTAGILRPPRFECVTWMVFGMLVLLLMLNVALYYKLWMLEEAPPYTLLDLHVLKEPPKNHEEWLKLLQRQETLHSVEMQKWQRVLKSAVKLLRQTEESLSELQHSIHPMASEKIMSVLQTHRDAASATVQSSSSSASASATASASSLPSQSQSHTQQEL